MSKVYTVNNGESIADQIPSIEYLSELLKIIEDALLYPDNEFSGFPSIKLNIEELPVGVKEDKVVEACDVKTDSNHKFITDGILATMVDKPSRFEVEQSLDAIKLEIMDKINETYMRIVNTPNVVNKLRDISTILNEDESTNGIINTMAYKIDSEDFEEHTKSSVHLNNNDRKALNVLIKCLSGGFADWNAKDNDYNAIKNKPDSLPANGGNADTISNHTIKDMINKYDYDIVIGTNGERYSKDSCDIYAENGYVKCNSISAKLELMAYNIVLFKRGHYKIDFINFDNKLVIFEGNDRRLTIIEAEKFINTVNSVFKNLSIYDSKIYIGSNCEISNVTFNNCAINLGMVDTNITNCVFDNCIFEYNGTMMNNIIKFNRYIHTKPIVYIGGNNIISENI